MTVFTNRIRTAYLRKRQKRETVLAALLLFGVMAACGIAGRMEERDAQAMNAIFTADRRVCVVDWATSVPVFERGK